MKKINQLLLFSFVLFFAVSCSTGRNAFKKGDYFRACFEAIERLRSNPDSKKSQQILIQAYPLAQKTAQREIENAQIANEADKFDVLAYQYDQINQLANSIFHCPKAYELIPHPTEYIAELSNAKQMAAEQSYNMGIAALKANNTIEQARIGLQYLTKANQYVYGYKDVIRKIEQAKYYATLRVIVQKPYTSNKYEYSAIFFYNNLLAEMNQNAKNRYVRFYSPEEAASENMRDPHQFIALNFEDFSIGNVRETNNTTDFKRDSVIVGTVTVNGKLYNTYNTVKAKLITCKKEIISNGTLSLRIIDAQNNRELQLKNFSGQYTWVTNWASFQGDDRALTSEQKKLCDQKPELPPIQQDMFIEFTKPIYSQAIYFIK